MRCLPNSVQVSEDPYVEIQVRKVKGKTSVVPLFVIALWQETPGEPHISATLLSAHPMLHPEAGMLSATLAAWDQGARPDDLDKYVEETVRQLDYEGRYLTIADLDKPLTATAITAYAVQVEMGIGHRGRRVQRGAWKAPIMQALNPGYAIRTVDELYEQQENLLCGDPIADWVEKF